MKNKPTPKQTMREFFAREDVKALQEIQKRTKYRSEENRKAYDDMVKLAEQIGAAHFFDGY